MSYCCNKCVQICTPCSFPCNPCSQPCNPCPLPCNPPSCNPCPQPCNPCSCHDCRRKHHKHRDSKKRCNKCYRHDCECVEYFPCLRVKCGFISATLTKIPNPTFYTAAGQVISYTYRITNTGSATICYPIQICDDKLGGWQIPCSYILPCSSQDFTRTYTIAAADLTVQSITNTATAYIQVKCKKWVCTQPSSATITYGSSDISGTISQTLVTGGTGADVTVTISNSASSLTDAFGVTLILPFPLNVGTVIGGAAIPPASAPVVSATSVTISETVIPIGATYTYTFSYFPTVIPGSYQWQGTSTTSSFDTNTTNNTVTSTLTFP